MILETRGRRGGDGHISSDYIKEENADNYFPYVGGSPYFQLLKRRTH